jgi:hypothetical protein
LQLYGLLFISPEPVFPQFACLLVILCMIDHFIDSEHFFGRGNELLQAR